MILIIKYANNFSYLNHSMLWRIRWEGHVARMWEKRNLDSVLVGKPEGKKDHLQDIRVDGKLILQRILKELDVRAWNRFIWLRIGTKWWEFVNTIIIL